MNIKQNNKKGNLRKEFRTYAEFHNGILPNYKHEFRSKDERWKSRKSKPIRAGILGISTASEFVTSGGKLDHGLKAIMRQIDHLLISNSYGPYQYIFMKDGMSFGESLYKSSDIGAQWNEKNKNITDYYKNLSTDIGSSIGLVDWIKDLRTRPDFLYRNMRVSKLFHECKEFRDAIKEDVNNLFERQLKRGEINTDGKFMSNIDSVYSPYIRSALEKITGYWIMADRLKMETGCDEIAYFHDGGVSPQIDLLRKNPNLLPDEFSSLKSIIYVDITFKSRKKKPISCP